MTNESQLNTLIKNSIVAAGGWAFKIPDPSGLSALQSIQNPFDGFGIMRGYPIYWESKYIRTLKSFNLQMIQDHQISNLCRIKELLTNIGEYWIVLGVKVNRGDNRVYIFRDVDEIRERREKRENFLKKELEKLEYYPVKKGLINL